MGRLLIDDPNRQNEKARLTKVKMGALCNYKVPMKEFLEYKDLYTLVLHKGTTITVNRTIFVVDNDLEYNIYQTLDDPESSLIPGKDYYVYMCDTGENEDDFVIKISLASTFPRGFNNTNSRKIGGFHYGIARGISENMVPVNTDGDEYGANWASNVRTDIVPRSVWCLTHRPKCAPEGMVYVTAGLWADIYQASDDSIGGSKSISGVNPMSGSGGWNWYKLNIIGMCSDKRMPTYTEWIALAYGSPSGIGNIVGSQVKPTGQVDNATSAVGCRDCVGNVRELIDGLYTGYALSTHGDKITYAKITNMAEWKNNPAMAAYTQGGRSFITPSCGGGYQDSTHCGERCLIMSTCPWDKSDDLGVRFVCEAE